MKLRHIVPSLEQQHGGPSVSVRALSTALAEAGHQVELMFTEPRHAHPLTRVPAPNLELRGFRRGWPQRICPSTSLRDAAGSGHADIIHHHGLWLRTLHYAVRAKHLTGAKLVLSPRGMTEPWAWHHHRLRKVVAHCLIHPGALAAVDGWHATSEQEAASLRRLGFRQPIVVSPNGVTVPSEAERASAARFWREALPALEGRRVALFYSRFHAKKRVRELIELWARRPADAWILAIVGIPDPITVSELDGLVRSKGLADRVVISDGTAKPAPYAVAELLLLPSHSENFGLVVAEAMAAGVAVVVTDTTPWQEMSLRKVGWCVAWEAFAESVAQATALSRESLAARGIEARAWMQSAFAWSTAAARLLDFYRGLPA